MPIHRVSRAPRRLALMSASALGFSLIAGAAFAQGYPGPETFGPPPGYYTNREHVEVVSPRPRPPQRSDIAAPIVNVSLSRNIDLRNYDLTTGYGVRRLRRHIRHTARELCHRLKFEYPVSYGYNPPCYRAAVHDAMLQADNAIAVARGYGPPPYRRDRED